MSEDQETKDLATSQVEVPKRPSIFRRTVRGIVWLAAGPAHWANVRTIGRGASLIRELLLVIRRQPQVDPQFCTDKNHHFDLQVTASTHGISVPALQARLVARRKQTAWIAYGSFLFACVLTLGWFRAALAPSWTVSRIMLGFDVLPLGALLILTAFYNALLNFQIRVGRRSSWREYLMTNEPFLPR